MSLAPIAIFWYPRFLKFKPPSKSGLEMDSKLTNIIVFSFFLPPFQFFFQMISSIFLRMPEGARRTENWNKGRLLRTDLVRTDLPTMLSQEKPQASNLFLNFSNWGSQSLLKALLRNTGRPRYLKEVQFEEAAKPKVLEMELSKLEVVFQQYGICHC